MILEGNTIDEALYTLKRLSMYAPYKYGGKWYLAIIDNEVLAFRQVLTLKKRAIKAGLNELQIYSVGK